MEQTNAIVLLKNLQGMSSIEREHIDNSKAVRDILLSRGIVPDQHLARENVKKVERR